MKRTVEEKERYMLWMGLTLGASVSRIRKLLEAFDSDAKAVFKAAEKKELNGTGILPSETALAMEKQAREIFIDKCILRLDELGISFSTLASDDYPPLLKQIYDPPAVIYYRGRLKYETRIPIAVIGSREPSEYGKRAARELSRELVENGATIISGLAYGIDCIAAEGAMEVDNAPYPTVAVLGSGPDVVYPEANRRTYDMIAERGAVISELMPGTEPKAMHFPMRNRIISGLSKGVLVIEAAEKSGTHITVNCALDEGRDVFALPGRIFDAKSAGTNGLIKSGMAKMVLGADDVLEEYGIKRRSTPLQAVDTSSLSEDEETVYKLLATEERSFDELCELTGLSASKLNSTLTSLEFSGIIKQSPGRMYSL